MRSAILLALILSACTPSRAAFLRLDVQVAPTHPGGPVLVDLPLAALRARNADLAPETAAYYFRGTSPLPHELQDRDLDGSPDHVRVQLPAGEQEHWVVIVSPAEPAHRTVPLGPGGSAEGVGFKQP